MPTINRVCETCTFWDRSEKHQFKPCSCPKFVYDNDMCSDSHAKSKSGKYPEDTLFYADFEGYEAFIEVGPKFGCVHWVKVEEL